jgi:hypothetical protein
VHDRPCEHDGRNSKQQTDSAVAQRTQRALRLVVARPTRHVLGPLHARGAAYPRAPSTDHNAAPPSAQRQTQRRPAGAGPAGRRARHTCPSARPPRANMGLCVQPRAQARRPCARRAPQPRSGPSIACCMRSRSSGCSAACSGESRPRRKMRHWIRLIRWPAAAAARRAWSGPGMGSASARWRSVGAIGAEASARTSSGSDGGGPRPFGAMPCADSA